METPEEYPVMMKCVTIVPANRLPVMGAALGVCNNLILVLDLTHTKSIAGTELYEDEG